MIEVGGQLNWKLYWKRIRRPDCGEAKLENYME
jgi:hypothetical protein